LRLKLPAAGDPWPLLRFTGLAVLFVFGFAATLRWLIAGWQGNPYYSHGLLVPLVVLFFVWRTWRTLPPDPSGSYWGLALLLPALAVHLLSLPVHAFYLSALMIVPVILGLLLLLRGWAPFRKLYFAVLLLALMVPLPFIPSLSPPLEAFAAAGASALARVIGMSVVQTGAELTIPGQAFIVGAPCSGLYSLVALTTLVAVFLYMVDGDPRGRFVLLLLVAPIALGANLIRITVLLAVAGSWGTEAALGYYHTYSSPVLFLIGLGGLILASRFLRCGGIRTDIF
jgi:exosortase